jgi:calcineurin-like phosphoesterase family protein
MRLELPANRTFFTSDPHFHHTNICKGISKWSDKESCRPYASLDEMNNELVKMMNVADVYDHIVCLGDWSFGGIEQITRFRNQIRCQNIYLVLGNHDHHIANTSNTDIRQLFATIDKRLHIVLDKQNIICDHYPIISWENMNKGWWHLHGHVHLPPKYALNKGKSMDVGVDGSSMNLYTFKMLQSILDNQPISINVLAKDHHLKEVNY